MESSMHITTQSRRDFMKTWMITVSLLPFKYDDLFALYRQTTNKKESSDFHYKYKTLSVDHLRELQEDIEKLKREGKLSDNEVYRSYIDNKDHRLPEDFPNAKSIIVMAISTRLMFVNFHWNRKKHEIMIPPQYYDDGISLENIQNTIHKKIIKEPGYKVVRAKKILLKRLAVRSGLGSYGRNNLCFVEGMGSYITLYAFYTDYKFEEDHWHGVRMLDNCKPCRLCVKQCPTEAISMRNFVIDVGRCIPLYNEVEGDFPKWIHRKAHNALMGCMMCQLHCPANHDAYKLAGRLEDVTEEETRKVLNGTPDEKTLESLSKKLRGFYPASSNDHFPVFTRNLRVLIG